MTLPPVLPQHAPLHLTKVAYGMESVEELRERIGAFEGVGQFLLSTRNMPRRHAEIAGNGSLFWIHRHHLVARTPILAFEEAEAGRTAIVCAPRLVLVRAVPRRAHQGWRYLEGTDAPPDLGEGGAGIEAMPPDLAETLAKLALI